MKPILFKPEMVQAILEGYKTQTRRIIKPQPNPTIHVNIGMGRSLDGKNTNGILYTKPYSVDTGSADFVRSPYGDIGDILWVREKWLDASIGKKDGRDIIHFASEAGKLYDEQGAKWKPSIFMPKAACRLFLKITDIRVERLYSISEEDAEAEGLLNY